MVWTSLSRLFHGAHGPWLRWLSPRLTVERAGDATRVRRATAFATIGVLPWWLCVVGEVDLQSPTLRGAFVAALPSILAGVRAARDTAPPPRRLDMLRALLRIVARGHRVLRRHRFSSFRLKAGGAGVLLRLL